MQIEPEHWPAISALLDDALALPVALRPAWLDAMPDSTHRATLERLLVNHARLETADFLNTFPRLALADEGEDAGPQQATADNVGPYRLLYELGRGGMGTVWLAERSDGSLKRPVALKLPHQGLATSLFAERLSRERDILASLSHPNIARLYDAGVTAEGQPFLALEYVQGNTLTEHCDAAQLDLGARIVLFHQVLAAVQYAHAHLVIHRDIKASNVLVDEQGQVRLLDFGIAKLMSDGRASETELTHHWGRALTLDFASPEQISGQTLNTSSDNYLDARRMEAIVVHAWRCAIPTSEGLARPNQERNAAMRNGHLRRHEQQLHCCARGAPSVRVCAAEYYGTRSSLGTAGMPFSGWRGDCMGKGRDTGSTAGWQVTGMTPNQRLGHEQLSNSDQLLERGLRRPRTVE